MQEDRTSSGSTGGAAGERDEETRLGEDYELKSADVLCGGRGTKETDHSHEGNDRLKVFLNARVDRYREAMDKVNKGDKSLIVSDVIQAVHDSGGRFVIKRGNVWYDAGLSRARDKITTAFRLILGKKNIGRRATPESSARFAAETSTSPSNATSRNADNQIRSNAAESPSRRGITSSQRVKRAKAPAAADSGEQAPVQTSDEYGSGQVSTSAAVTTAMLNVAGHSTGVQQSRMLPRTQLQQDFVAPQGTGLNVVQMQNTRPGFARSAPAPPAFPQAQFTEPNQLNQAGGASDAFLQAQRSESTGLIPTIPFMGTTSFAQQLPHQREPITGSAFSHQDYPNRASDPNTQDLGPIIVGTGRVRSLSRNEAQNFFQNEIVQGTAYSRLSEVGEEKSHVAIEEAHNTNNSSPIEDPPSSTSGATVSSFERSVIRRTSTPPPQSQVQASADMTSTGIPRDFSVPFQGDQTVRKSSSDESESSLDRKPPAF